MKPSTTSVVLWILLVCCVPATLATDYCQRKGQRKALIIALDGTKGAVLWSAMQSGGASNMASLANSGKAAQCDSSFDSKCASAHSGPRNRSGTAFPNAPTLLKNFSWVTSPGWLSVVTGVDNEKHLVASNDYQTQANYAATSVQYPTLFRRAKQMGLRTAAGGTPNFLSDSAKLGIVDFECGLNGANGTNVDPNAGSSCNLDYRQAQHQGDLLCDEKTTIWAMGRILDSSDCADVIMTHFDLIDESGHLCGFDDNVCYKAAILHADLLVGRLIDAIWLDTALRQNSWLIVITSDHGGAEKSHGSTWGEDEAVPFILSLMGPRGGPLVDLQSPVKHYDVAPTVMAWFGLNLTDAGLDGRVQGVVISAATNRIGNSFATALWAALAVFCWCASHLISS